MIAGQIDIIMQADIVRLLKDMNDAKGVVTSAANAMGNAWEFAKGALAGMIAGLSIGAFTSWMKAAIDAGDATKEFSQKTGVAAADVAGLQLAFKQGGVDGDALTASISKMSKQMAAGNDAFKTLGIETRNTDGTLRSVKDVLYETAEAFAGVKDGAAKSAIAQEIFGKSGAALIPTLNEGADGLREMAEMAEKLGLVISEDVAEQSDKFNDTMELIHMSSQGLARTVMAEVLPTLNDLAGAFLKSKTEGDGLHRSAEVIAAGLKILYSVAVVGVEVFSTLGKIIGALAAQLTAIATGDFKLFKQIGDEANADIKNDWTKSIANLGSVWDGTAGKGVDAMAKMTRAQKNLTLATKDQETATKKQRDEWEKLVKAGADLVNGIRNHNDIIQLELDLSRKLTEGEKQLIDLEQKLKDGKIALGSAEHKLALEEIARGETLRSNQKWMDDSKKANDAMFESILKATDAINDQATKQEAANAVIGLSKEAVEALTVAETQRAAAMARQKADMYDKAGVEDSIKQAYLDQADALDKLASKQAEGVQLKAAKEAADAWQKTADLIYDGISDSLLRAFESGKGFFKSLWNDIKSSFERTVFKMAINGILSIGGELLGGVAGQVLSGGSGAGSALSGLSGAGSLAQMFGVGGGAGGIFGSSAAYGAAIGTTNIGAGSQAAMLASQTGEFGFAGAAATSEAAAGAGAGASAAAGGAGEMIAAFGPYAIVALALYAMFADHSKWSLGSVASGAFGGNNDFGTTKSDLPYSFGNNTEHERGPLEPLVNSIGALLAGTAEGFGGKAGSGLGITAATDLDREGQIAGIVALVLNGQRIGGVQTGTGAFAGDNPGAASKIASDQMQAWFQGAVPQLIVQGLQQSDLPKRFSDFFNSVSAADLTAAKAAEMLQTANAIKTLTDSVLPLGGAFARLSDVSLGAVQNITKLTGGMDAFMQKTADYLANYYSEEERMKISAQNVLKVVGAAGIDASGATSRNQLRMLMDSLDPSSAQGQAQMAALLNVEAEYAKLADYLTAQGTTLGALAEGAPQVAAINALTTPAQETADATKETAETVKGVATSTADTATATQAIADGQDTQTSALAAGFNFLGSKLDQVNLTLADIDRLSTQANARAAG